MKIIPRRLCIINNDSAIEYNRMVFLSLAALSGQPKRETIDCKRGIVLEQRSEYCNRSTSCTKTSQLHLRFLQSCILLEETKANFNKAVDVWPMTILPASSV